MSLENWFKTEFLIAVPNHAKSFQLPRGYPVSNCRLLGWCRPRKTIHRFFSFSPPGGHRQVLGRWGSPSWLSTTYRGAWQECSGRSHTQFQHILIVVQLIRRCQQHKRQRVVNCIVASAGSAQNIVYPGGDNSGKDLVKRSYCVWKAICDNTWADGVCQIMSSADRQGNAPAVAKELNLEFGSLPPMSMWHVWGICCF